MKHPSHIDPEGSVRMVDVSGKKDSSRRALAEGFVVMGKKLTQAVEGNSAPKGSVLNTARLAGIMAAKRTSELIPLCHQIPLSHVQIEFEVLTDRIRITAVSRTLSNTGVEMEALTAVSVAALTIYDMLKSLSHEMRFEGIRLLEKSGGKSGEWRWKEDK